MTDHEAFHDLDARAARAAGDLRAAAAARPRPAFDPDRSPSIPVATGAGTGRAVPRRTLAAVAAALVLVVGGVVWAANRPDADDRGPATTTTDAPRPFVLGDVPGGLTLAGAGETTGGDEADASLDPPLVIYGPASDQPRLGLAVLGDFDPDGLGAGVERVDGAGVEAYALDGRGFGPRVLVAKVDGRAVIGLAPTLSREDLLALVADVEVSGRRAELGADALPDGWGKLGEEPSLLGMISPVAAMRGSIGPGSYVAYVSGETTAEVGEPGGRSVVVASVSGGDVALHAAELAAGEVRRPSVRGHEAVAGTATVEGVDGSTSTSAFVSWLERPGELIRVTALNVPLDELLSIAEGVEPAGEEAWRDLVERTQLGDFDTGQYRESQGELVELARGRFDDGTAWVLRLWPADGEDAAGPNASLDLQVALGGDSSSGSSSGQGTAIGEDGQPVEQALGSSTSVNQAGRTFGAGFVGDGVAEVVLVGKDGAELGRAEIVEGLGRRAWVAEATDGVAEVVARSADGTELGRQDLGLGTEHAPDPMTPTTVAYSAGD